MITLVKKHINAASKIREDKALHKQNSQKIRPVTAEEFCQVSFVTIREGVNHCRWPREVIQQFLLAEV